MIRSVCVCATVRVYGAEGAIQSCIGCAPALIPRALPSLWQPDGLLILISFPFQGTYWTPLHHCAHKGRGITAAALIKAGGDLTAKSRVSADFTNKCVFSCLGVVCVMRG